jgi:hypothetical protein
VEIVGITWVGPVTPVHMGRVSVAAVTPMIAAIPMEAAAAVMVVVGIIEVVVGIHLVLPTVGSHMGHLPRLQTTTPATIPQVGVETIQVEVIGVAVGEIPIPPLRIPRHLMAVPLRAAVPVHITATETVRIGTMGVAVAEDTVVAVAAMEIAVMVADRRRQLRLKASGMIILPAIQARTSTAITAAVELMDTAAMITRAGSIVEAVAAAARGRLHPLAHILQVAAAARMAGTRVLARAVCEVHPVRMLAAATTTALDPATQLQDWTDRHSIPLGAVVGVAHRTTVVP